MQHTFPWIKSTAETVGLKVDYIYSVPQQSLSVPSISSLNPIMLQLQKTKMKLGSDRKRAL